jgi:PTS system N-acetylglucosamine-specific IIC component
MFLAPVLYGVHALLTGLSLALMSALHVRIGFTFSAGTIDYLLSYGLGQKAWLLLPVGLAYFVVYYGVFTFCIRHFQLATPGREAVGEAALVAMPASVGGERALAFVKALGGAGNLLSVDACATRLRLNLGKNELINEPSLKALGAKGVLRVSAGSVQVILGPEADRIADEIRAAVAPAASAQS